MNEYIELHKELIHWLREFGVYHRLDDRLDLAWYRNNLKYAADSEAPNFEPVIALMDKLVILRTQGKEPIHASGRYTELTQEEGNGGL
jgi:hypothetical protein